MTEESKDRERILEYKPGLPSYQNNLLHEIQDISLQIKNIGHTCESKIENIEEKLYRIERLLNALTRHLTKADTQT